MGDKTIGTFRQTSYVVFRLLKIPVLHCRFTSVHSQFNLLFTHALLLTRY